jgi:SAM-dependent methyltransferase
VLDIRKIRPADAEAEYLNLLQRELRDRFLDDHGALRAEVAVCSDCPACGNSERQEYDPGGPHRYQCCAACGCVYADPRPAPHVIEEYVRESEAFNYFHEHLLIPSEADRRAHVFGEPLALLKGLLRSGRILELGSAVGTLLQMLAEEGYEAEGVELCRFSVEHNRRCGRIVHDRPTERLGLESGSFDGVVAWGVLPVLASPRDAIKAAHSALRRGGVLVLDALNVRSLEYLTFRTERLNPAVLYQVWTGEAIRRLLSDAGFLDIVIKTPGRTDVDLVRRQAGSACKELGAFLNTLLFDESPGMAEARSGFQDFISRHHLSSHLTATARKP